jgi:hypothetical protein
MDHDAYENEMMDTVNRHREEAAKKAKVKWSMVVNKNDARVFARGLKRTLIAMLTAVTFAAAVMCFITVAKVTGYWAVLMFFVALIVLAASLVLLYAQGILRVESQGDNE